MFLITGATGNVGGEVLHAMLDANQDVRALTRGARPSELPPEVEAAPADLNKPGTLSAALAGVRGVFVLSGYKDMPGLLAAARDANALQWVPQLRDGDIIREPFAEVPIAAIDPSDTPPSPPSPPWP